MKSMFSIKNLLVAASLVCSLASSVAHASTKDIGTVGDTFVLTTTPVALSSYSFFDQINFGISTTSNLSVNAFSWEIPPYLSINNLYGELWTGTFGDPGSMQVGSFNGNGLTYAFNGLTAGNYHLDIVGKATGGQGGIYSVGLLAAPVPEPETYLMLLSGLGLIATMVKRRRSAA